jgi:endonuclease/exonuclease/phosphatase family metal-dependent hydrolase
MDTLPDMATIDDRTRARRFEIAREGTARHSRREALGPVATVCLVWSLGLVGCLGHTGKKVDPAPSAETGRDVRLRIVSFNIRHGVGLDGTLDLARTAAVLEALAPDVVLLQEVDERCRRSGSVDQAAWLGDRLGMQHRFAPFMDHDGGRYGLATLSRAPIDASRVLPLPPGRQEPRAALETSLRVGGRTVRIANAHLDWLDDSPERLAQAEALRDALTPLRGGPLVVGGDLNDTPASAALAALLTAEDGALTRATGAGATFPADEPSKTIDHLLYGPSEAWRASALSVVEERLASDHRPILLDLTLAVQQ